MGCTNSKVSKSKYSSSVSKIDLHKNDKNQNQHSNINLNNKTQNNSQKVSQLQEITLQVQTQQNKSEQQKFCNIKHNKANICQQQISNYHDQSQQRSDKYQDTNQQTQIIRESININFNENKNQLQINSENDQQQIQNILKTTKHYENPHYRKSRSNNSNIHNVYTQQKFNLQNEEILNIKDHTFKIDFENENKQSVQLNQVSNQVNNQQINNDGIKLVKQNPVPHQRFSLQNEEFMNTLENEIPIEFQDAYLGRISKRKISLCNEENLWDQISQRLQENNLDQAINNSYCSQRTIKQNYQLKFEQNGVLYEMEHEEVRKIPQSILQFLNQNNLNNVSMNVKVSMLGHQSNSDLTKIRQYFAMLFLNNYDLSEFDDESLKIESINTNNLRYSRQFEKFRQYLYFQQRENDKSRSKQEEFEISDELEEQYRNKIIESNNDLNECAKEIGMIALKHVFEQQGVRLLYKHAEGTIEQIQQQLHSVQSQMTCYREAELLQDQYKDIQTHLAQTGFCLDNYYSMKLEDSDEWYYERAMENKQLFAQYFKNQIVRQCQGAQEDDILILDIQKGSICVNFIYDKPLKNIQFGEQYWEQIPVKRLASELYITDDYFDNEWDMYWESSDEDYRGNINGESKIYHFPCGYYGLGLKVTGNNLYPDDGWLGSDTSDNTWIVLFHKTHQKAVSNILETQFDAGKNQAYQYDQCRFGRGEVGKGIYFSDNVNECEMYGSPINIEEKLYSLVFQCRVNPLTIKSPVDEPCYFVSNDPKDVRPYRILIKENNFETQFES